MSKASFISDQGIPNRPATAIAASDSVSNRSPAINTTLSGNGPVHPASVKASFPAWDCRDAKLNCPFESCLITHRTAP